MAKAKNYGDYIVLNGKRVSVQEHPTDFSVMANVEELNADEYEHVAPLARNLTRAGAKDSKTRDDLMDEVRRRQVAHHIYQIEDTGEEIVIDDRILVKLVVEGTGELARIMQEYHLIYVGKMGESHVLQVTDETDMNPLKVANRIAERPGVAAASPQVMLDINMHQGPALFGEQWYFDADSVAHPDVMAGADVSALEAWQITKGHPDIVVAVIDDGFDLEHPALAHVRVHPDKRNYVEGDSDVGSRNQDYHGTPVASIAVGGHVPGSSMCGMAPNCTFLPIRIGFGPTVAPIDFLEVFRYVSARADVVNCSFGISPTSMDVMPEDFRREITRLCESGGRRSKGLVMVFSAGNDDAPTYLDGADNVNGVLFTRRGPFGGSIIAEIPAGRPVYSGYPLTPGVVVAGAMSSRKRKSGYSSWGPHLSVTSPSNNSHYIMDFISEGADPRRARFVADYRGLGQVAAVNRAGRGRPFSPILDMDNVSTIDLNEAEYTRRFGGTSGAAPIITGTAALMLSVNPELSALRVRQIMMATADKDLDFILDLQNDPNVQGLPGDFQNGHSLYFGAGKINAFHAVRRAQALATQAADMEAAATPAAPATNGMATKQAAFTELAGETMAEISAERFLAALRAGGMTLQHLAVWPEKKKVELFVEPENMGDIKVEDLLARLQAEKKKLELELPPDDPIFGPIRGPIINEKKKREIEIDPPWIPPVIPIDWRTEKKKVELEAPFNPNLNGSSAQFLESIMARIEEKIMARLTGQRDATTE